VLVDSSGELTLWQGQKKLLCTMCAQWFGALH